MENGKVIIFSAPSGSGKTTIVQHLLSTNSNLAFSVSATTRALRGKEVNGKDYYFMSQAEFLKLIQEDAFVEYEEVYANTYYGTLKTEVQRIWNEGKVVIFDLDVVGGLNIKRILGDRALAVFVRPPSVEILHQRLSARATESKEDLAKRVNKAIHELTYEPQFDAVVVNDTLEHAFLHAQQLLDQFLTKPAH